MRQSPCLSLLAVVGASSSESGRQVINPQRRYGDMPLIVLTSGQHPMPPDVPTDVGEQAAQYFQALASGHDAYAALSTRGRNQLVPDSGHFIQLENPTVVLAAINRALAGIGPPKQVYQDLRAWSPGRCVTAVR